MAFDERLGDRIRQQLADRDDVIEKEMFGGLCFMVRGHMCCGIVDDELMARVGPERYGELLEAEHSREMDFTGRKMRGMLYIDEEGIRKDENLARWLGFCVEFVESLPVKAPK